MKLSKIILLSTSLIFSIISLTTSGAMANPSGNPVIGKQYSYAVTGQEIKRSHCLQLTMKDSKVNISDDQTIVIKPGTALYTSFVKNCHPTSDAVDSNIVSCDSCYGVSGKKLKCNDIGTCECKSC